MFFLVKDSVDIIQCKIELKVPILADLQRDGSLLSSSIEGWKIISVTMSVVLLVDGHTCHINVEVSKLCQANKIHLYCFPPHTSHMMQPLDVCFFKPLKVAWSKACEKFKLDHPGCFVDKKVFAEVFKNSWVESTKKDV